MVDFPKRIDCGDFELVKPEATFDKAHEFFGVVMKNKVFLSQWLEWPDFIPSQKMRLGICWG